MLGTIFETDFRYLLGETKTDFRCLLGETKTEFRYMLSETKTGSDICLVRPTSGIFSVRRIQASDICSVTLRLPVLA
jgi:hypothetical protein